MTTTNEATSGVSLDEIDAEIRRIKESLGPPLDIAGIRVSPALWARVRDAFPPKETPHGFVDPLGLRVEVCPHEPDSWAYDTEGRVSGYLTESGLVEIPRPFRWKMRPCYICHPPKPPEIAEAPPSVLRRLWTKLHALLARTP